LNNREAETALHSIIMTKRQASGLLAQIVKTPDKDKPLLIISQLTLAILSFWFVFRVRKRKKNRVNKLGNFVISPIVSVVLFKLGLKLEFKSSSKKKIS